MKFTSGNVRQARGGGNGIKNYKSTIVDSIVFLFLINIYEGMYRMGMGWW